ncbi:TetR/AcrR family transcriptional regulator [Paenibacillus sp. URB8-2]|uniref:TetR/AcrR family transcriptional regulator n=1 Tax=Paenibacillus sp. URB8-2 TaxID=2741301 RepID=UPI0015C271BA|nr:TetR/AcrR family transcriptional regulator [Paenibacillus sp. URB8-2]BCG58215.1 TetR family transcriptional regulator [Paenibacillus sp. URB8-2]
MTKINGFEKRAAKIRRKIMKTTMEMLKTWEPKRMRIADIAKAAGVSQVTIYNYFGSKEKLLEQSFKDYIDQSIDGFEKFMQEKPSVKDFVKYSIDQEKAQYSVLSPSQIKELMVDDQEMFGYIQERYEKTVLPLIVRLVEEGKSRNEISPKISSNSVLIFMNMYMQSVGDLLEVARKQDNMDVFIEEMTHLFFYGLCGRED